MKEDNKDLVDQDPRQSERSTNAQIRQYVSRVIELISQNKNTREICDILEPEIGKSKDQIKRYIRKANEALAEDFNNDAHIRRSHMEQSLREDLNEAMKQYRLADNSRDAAVWMKLMMEIKDRIAKYTPDEVKDDNQSIKVEYTLVNPKLIESEDD